MDGLDGSNYDAFYEAKNEKENCSFWIVIYFKNNIANDVLFDDKSNCLGTIPGFLFEKKSGDNSSDFEN